MYTRVHTRTCVFLSCGCLYATNNEMFLRQKYFRDREKKAGKWEKFGSSVQF